jgi:peroxiredoxin Q/BCP
MSKKTRKKPLRNSARKSTRTPSGKTSAGSAKSSRKMTLSRTHPTAAKKTSKSAITPSKSAISKTLPKTPATQAKKTLAPVPLQSALVEGARAPAFCLPRDGGGTISLSDYSGKKLVLFFYPRADTPGCTKEAIDFTRLASAFAAIETEVLGVSADPQRTQEAFRDKHHLTTPLVSDEKHEMLDAYGAWGEKSMYGRTFQGILRTTVLIGADGRIAKIWRRVKVDGHADAVLAAAQDL